MEKQANHNLRTNLKRY